jgi:20S proteasome subunit beta 3
VRAARCACSVVVQRCHRGRFGPYFCEPVICGLTEKLGQSLCTCRTARPCAAECAGALAEPFITAQDLIGAPVYTKDFVVSGTSSEEMYGMCEALWRWVAPRGTWLSGAFAHAAPHRDRRPEMEAEDLFETISQCLLAAVDRDCLAGWGAQVVVM